VVVEEEDDDAFDESARRGEMDRRAQRALLEQDEFGWPGAGDTWRQSGIHVLDAPLPPPDLAFAPLEPPEPTFAPPGLPSLDGDGHAPVQEVQSAPVAQVELDPGLDPASAAELERPEAPPPEVELLSGIDLDVEPDEVELTLSAEEIIPEEAPLGSLEAALPDADASALQAARRRAQDDLVREMQEALRRSSSTTDDAWFSESPGEVAPIAARFTPAPPPADAHPAVFTPAPAFTPAPDDVAAPFEQDLWRIVSFDTSSSANAPSAFEEAIGKVDASLLQLVGAGEEPAGDEPETGFEVEFQAFDTLSPDGETVPTRENLLPSDEPGLLADSGDFDGSEWADDEDDLADENLDPAEAARLRRQRLLRRAMQNLGAFDEMRSRPAAPGSPGEAPAATPAPSPAPPTSDGPGSDLAEAIERRHRELSGLRDHFRVLGVPQGAHRDQVKTAFLRLVKQFHPDRLPADLRHLAPKMTAVFESIREAYDTLHDEQRRADWMASQQKRATARPATPVPSRGDDAQIAFKKGELALRKRDYVAAEAFFEQAYRLDKSANALAAQAWALYVDPNRRSEAPRARALMQQALQLQPTCDRAHYQLGVVARVDGQLDVAERHFREAVRSNPKHLEANQELRLIDMRRKRGQR